MRRTPRRRGKGVEENAQRHDALPTELVDEPPAHEAEDSAAERRNPEHTPGPIGDDGVVWRELQELGDRRDADQRRHEQFVCVEQEADAGDSQNDEARACADAGVGGSAHGKRSGKGRPPPVQMAA